MADLIRPEARAALWRWRECLAALPLIGLGAVWAGRFGLVQIAGWGLLALGAALIITGVPRARFRRAETGAGVVQLTEHQLTYLGPQLGGAVSVDQITRVALDGAAWRIWAREGAQLRIPTDAAGAELLFDVFERLPGFAMGPALRHLDQPPAALVTIWRRGPRPIDTPANSPHALH